MITADTILKRTADVMVLKNGVISACDADDPHYAIRAGRVWILGNKEWAMTDAVFSLGNVPILWLPFFYYPGGALQLPPLKGPAPGGRVWRSALCGAETKWPR